jgi:hypothetical protein
MPYLRQDVQDKTRAGYLGLGPWAYELQKGALNMGVVRGVGGGAGPDALDTHGATYTYSNRGDAHLNGDHEVVAGDTSTVSRGITYTITNVHLTDGYTHSDGYTGSYPHTNATAHTDTRPIVTNSVKLPLFHSSALVTLV